MRPELAKVTVASVPLSVVSTTELPVTDFTVPTTFAGGGACARTELDKSRNARHEAIKTCATVFQHELRGFERIHPLFNSNTRLKAERVKNCQIRVKLRTIGDKPVGGEIHAKIAKRFDSQKVTNYLRLPRCCGFHFEQLLLALNPPAISAHIAVRSHDAMTRDRDRHRVGRACACHRAYRGRLFDCFGNVGI
jgi:hypothetical protein